MAKEMDAFARSACSAIWLLACATPAYADHEEGFLLVGIFLLSTLIFLAALPFMRAGWIRSFCALLAYFITAVIAALPVDIIFPSSHASETQQMTLLGLYLSACGWMGAFALLLWWRHYDAKRSGKRPVDAGKR